MSVDLTAVSPLMLRKIVVGWLCLFAGVVAAFGLTIQAAIARVRDRIGSEDDADKPASADGTRAD